MAARRLVILGASGFVGTILTERMRSRSGWDVVPVIHSPASAWRLARHGQPLAQVDILDRSALRQVMQAATHVVNCTRGPREVMIDGFSNVLEEAKAVGVQRLVHLSSVMVYGDPPPKEAATEDGPVVRGEAPESYAGMKLEQDEMVQAAARKGLRSVVLCPPNIGGPFSLYLCGLVDGIRRGTFAMVGDGLGPCNLVDVRSLSSAVELSLQSDESTADGRRFFITDGGDTTWKDLVDALHELAGLKPVLRLDRELVARRASQLGRKPEISLGKSLRHLVSSDVRAALRKDPFLAKIDKAARSGVGRLGSAIEGKLRRGIEGLPPVPVVDPLSGIQFGLCTQQLRQVRHSPARAKQMLGYEPPVDFKQSIADFKTWYRCFFGVDDESWSLNGRLFER